MLSSPSCLAVCVGEARAIRRSFFLFVALSPESLQPISSDGSASRRRACKKDLRLCEPNPPARLILAPPPVPSPPPFPEGRPPFSEAKASCWRTADGPRRRVGRRPAEGNWTRKFKAGREGWDAVGAPAACAHHTASDFNTVRRNKRLLKKMW